MLEALILGCLLFCGILVAAVLFATFGLTVGILGGALKLVGWSLKAVFAAVLVVPLVVTGVVLLGLAAGAMAIALALLPILPFIILGAILLGLRKIQRPASPSASVH